MLTHSRDLYLDLMKKVVTNTIYQDNAHGWVRNKDFDAGLPSIEYDDELRAGGRDIPRVAHTMIGGKRLDNLHACVEQVLSDDIPGDLIETGVWRGGATIFMRAVLKAYDIKDRTVWVADSFEGIPKGDPVRYPGDDLAPLYRFNDVFGVSRTIVEENFRRYGLLDDQVRFLPGYFRDTLPDAPVESLAVLRMDGDLFESTMDALVHLYPKLSVGGYVIVDDYRALPPCRVAVYQYRREHGITDPIEEIDGVGVFWRRTR
ncbi:TylF/MycF family methyltransferase [Streptomyces sp. NPDC127108]|uniref:TylF/MycF family methyltransferase n=1 Tax=Streptomyces sp. NPDC127108 TaxID=3345361 RepID=UPI003625BD14